MKYCFPSILLEKSSGVFSGFLESGIPGNREFWEFRGNPGDFREIWDFRGISGKFRENPGFRGSRGPPPNPGFWGIFRENPGFPGKSGSRGVPGALVLLGARGGSWGGSRGGPDSGVRDLQPLPGFWGFSGCRGPFNKCIFRSGFGVFFCARRCGEFGEFWCGNSGNSREISGDPGNLVMSKRILLFLS